MFEAGALIYRIQAVGGAIFKQELREADQAAKNAGQSVGEAGRKTEEMGRKADQAKPKVKGIGDELGGLSLQGQQAAREVGTALTVIGAGIIATSALTIRAARDWETAWTGVTKTVEGTPEQLDAVEEGLRDLTRELPASHEEIAAVAEAAGQLGVRAQDIVQFTRTMLDLGATTNLTSDEAATSLKQLMNIMQTAPEDVDRLGASVVALGNNGASTERDIVQMAQRIAGAGKIVGLTEGETLGLANALASVGIEAEAGGTSVSNIMIDISQAVSTKGQRLIDWARLAGLSADDFAERWSSSPADALALVVEGMGELDAAGGDVFATLADLGQTDVRVTRALLGLATSGDLLRRSIELGNESWAENIALQTEAEKRYDTAAAKIDIARNKVNDMAIALGEQLLPYVIEGADAVGDFADTVGALPPGLQGAVTVLGALVGVIALSGGAALIAVPKIIAFKAALATLAEEMPRTYARGQQLRAFFTGPWGIALGVALIAVDQLGKYLEDLAASTEEVIDAGKGASTAYDIMSTSMTDFLGSQKLAEQYLDGLNDALIQSGEVAEDWTQIYTGANSQIIASVQKVGEAIAEVAKQDLPEAQREFSLFAAETDGSRERLLELIDAMPAYRDELISQAKAAGDYSDAMDEAERDTVLLSYAQQDSAGSAESAAEAYVDADDAASGLARTIEQLLEVVNKANAAGADAVTSNIAYQDALRDLEDQVEAVKAGTEGYALGLDTATEAGARNYEQLVRSAEKGIEAAEAQLAVDHNTEAYLATLRANRDTILQNAEDLGATAEQLEFISENIVAMPTEKEIELTVDAVQAQAALDDLNSSLDRFRSSGLSVQGYIRNVDRLADGGRVGAAAPTGVVEFFAGGGESHLAQRMSSGAGIRVFNEPETGGEYYIPAAPSKRERSTRVLAQAADEFGYRLVEDRPSGPMKIQGTLDLGHGLTGFIEGVVKQAVGEAGR